MARGEYGSLSRDAEGRVRWGKRAAGILFQRDDDGRVLLALRSQDVMDPGLWGIPGGRVEPGEQDIDSAFIEAAEELGTLSPKFEVVGEYPYRSGDFTYTTFHVMISGDDANVWVPVLNWENDDWGWFAAHTIPENIHPGVGAVLETMNA